MEIPNTQGRRTMDLRGIANRCDYRAKVTVGAENCRDANEDHAGGRRGSGFLYGFDGPCPLAADGRTVAYTREPADEMCWEILNFGLPDDNDKDDSIYPTSVGPCTGAGSATRGTCNASFTPGQLSGPNAGRYVRPDGQPVVTLPPHTPTFTYPPETTQSSGGNDGGNNGSTGGETDGETEEEPEEESEDDSQGDSDGESNSESDSAEDVQVVVSSTDSCSAGRSIPDADSCRLAAESLGLKYQNGFSRADRPAGCYKRNRKVWFNRATRVVTESSDRFSLCCATDNCSVGETDEDDDDEEVDSGDEEVDSGRQQFVQSASGTCAEGTSYITDEDRCHDAAESLGLEVRLVFSNAQRVRGCYVRNGKAYFNRAQTFTATSADRKSICEVTTPAGAGGESDEEEEDDESAGASGESDDEEEGEDSEESDGALVKLCLFYNSPSGHARSDPIINQECASDHMHTFYGPLHIHPTTSYSDLLSTLPQYSTSPVEENQSSYWHPSIYRRRRSNGENSTFELVTNLEVGPYYRWDNSVSPPTQAYPPGFRMIAHSPSSDPGAQGKMMTECCNYVGDDETEMCEEWPFLHFPERSCDFVGIALAMPTCWDGVELGDKNNHVDHMRYTTNGEVAGPCPDGFPVRLPELQLFVRILQYQGGDFKYQLSNGNVGADSEGNGDRQSFHVDFFNGWKEGTFQTLIDNCPVPEQNGYNPYCECLHTNDGANELPNDITFRPRDDAHEPMCEADVRRLIIDEPTHAVDVLPRGTCQGADLKERSYTSLDSSLFTCDSNTSNEGSLDRLLRL